MPKKGEPIILCKTAYRVRSEGRIDFKIIGATDADECEEIDRTTEEAIQKLGYETFSTSVN